MLDIWLGLSNFLSLKISWSADHLGYECINGDYSYINGRK